MLCFDKKWCENFLKGSYGPYSKNVKDSIIALSNANLIIERTLGRMVSISVSNNVVIQEDKFSKEEWVAMKKTVDLFGRIKSTDQAEMIATVLYSYDELNNGTREITDKDVYDFVMEWKRFRL